MLHLIERRLPAPLHRLALRIAHNIRHRWRKIAKPHLSGVSVILHRGGEDNGHRVMLVKHTYGPDYWSLPGGGMDRGEKPEAAARREMREELSVELNDLTSLGTVEEELSGTTHTAYLFSAIADGKVTPDGREISKAEFFEPAVLPCKTGAIARSRITYFLGTLEQL